MAEFIDEKKVDMESGRRESLTAAERKQSVIGDSFTKRLSVAFDEADAREGQLFSMGETDPALDAKMRLLNSVSPMQLPKATSTS
jgi:hypothetical protein